ncbi:hypothetical protein ABPG75_001600 [Micractinium tetrahymenae]
MGAATSTARAWRPGLSPAPPGAGPPLTVCTYNILADRHATSGMHDYCPAKFLAWAYRKQRILEELLQMDADIVCLQEVERPFFEAELEPAMAQHGYQALYYARQRRPSEPPTMPEEGISLLYRTDRLEHRDSKAVRLADWVDPSLRGRFWQAVRARQDGAVFALLRDRATRRHLLAGCTHLFWDPRFPDVKAAQAALLCKAAAGFLRRQPALRLAPEAELAAAMPTVIAGDFNSLPRKAQSDAFDAVPPGQVLVSGVHTILAGPEGGIDSTHPDHPARRSLAGGPGQHELPSLRLSSAPFRLASAAAQAWGREPPVTNRTASFSGTLDYVFLSRGHWAVGEALTLPYRFDPAPAGQPAAVNDPTDVPLAQLPAIPNARFPSDHLPLAFRLHLLPAGGQ